MKYQNTDTQNLQAAGAATRLSQTLWLAGNKLDYGKDDAGYYDHHPHTILKKEFHLDEVPEQAHLHMACRGLYICRINDTPVSEYVLNGSWTNFTKRVYFDTREVSDLLQPGMNTIEIELGNGFWNPSPLRFFGKYNLRERLAQVGDPCIQLLLESDAETLCASDENWLQAEGDLLFNNVYLGEVIDCSRTYAKKVWKPARTFTEVCTLEPALADPIIKARQIRARSVTKWEDGYLYDFGEIITGFGGGTFTGTAGQKVEILYAESMREGVLDLFGNANGSVGETMPDGNKVCGGPGAPEKAFEIDTILLDEGKNTWENRFTYHSFRFMIVKGIEPEQAEELYAWYVHAALKQTGHVHTDSKVYSQLWDAALRTKRNNMHFSFEDCARERLGYGGDMVTLADSNLYTFDAHNFMKKIIMDFRLDQTEAGGIPETAPYMGIQSQGTAAKEGPLLWQYVYPYLTGKMIQFYGDTAFARQEYPYIKKQIDYLLSWNPEELATHCLGDHGSVLIASSFYTPTPAKEFSGWCSQLMFVQTFLYIARAIGKEEAELQRYVEAENHLKQAIEERFAREDGSYADDTQTALAFAAYCGLGNPESLTKKLAEKIEDEGMMTAGIFGMKFTYDLLHKYGYDQVVENWLLSENEISFRHMLEDGNKAFAELFKGSHYSGNHAMFTSFVTWYYNALGGITLNAAGNGIFLQPFFSTHVQEADCIMNTRLGHVTSHWQRSQEDGSIVFEVSLPHGLQIEKINLPDDCTLILHQEKEGQFLQTVNYDSQTPARQSFGAHHKVRPILEPTAERSHGIHAS